jgi:tetratricopeptide (TPR) repeat protein
MSAPDHIARFNLIRGDFEEASKWIRYVRDNGHPEDADFDEGEFDFLQGRH